MKIVWSATSTDMLKEFLSAEMMFSGHRYSRLFSAEEKDLFETADEAQLSRWLKKIRGYWEVGERGYIFSSLTEKVIDWKYVQIGAKEIGDCYYIRNWSRSGRKVSEVADHMKSHNSIVSIRRAITDAEKMPKVILLTEKNSGQYVVLEGHHRMTAWYLEDKENLTVLVWETDSLTSWICYPL